MKPITNEQAEALLEVMKGRCLTCITKPNTKLIPFKKIWQEAGLIEEPEETAIEKARRLRSETKLTFNTYLDAVKSLCDTCGSGRLPSGYPCKECENYSKWTKKPKEQ